MAQLNRSTSCRLNHFVFHMSIMFVLVFSSHDYFRGAHGAWCGYRYGGLEFNDVMHTHLAILFFVHFMRLLYIRITKLNSDPSFAWSLQWS